MSADGNPPTIYEMYGMRTKEEILEDFYWTKEETGRTYDADSITQMKLLVEVLCDIRDAILKKGLP